MNPHESGLAGLKSKNTNRVLALASVVLTPWLIFLSSSLQLYLVNREKLDQGLSLLLPFFLATVVGVATGYGILHDTRQNGHYRMAPWLFFLAGPFFLVSNTTTVAASFQMGGLLAFWFAIILWILTAFLLRKVRLRVAMLFSTVFAILLIGSDTARILLSLPHAAPDEAFIQGRQQVLEWDSRSNRPNIYHIVFDGYQSNIFGLLLDKESEAGMKGLNWYKDTVSPYANTRISIPAVFAGKPLGLEMSLRELQYEAFNGSSGLLGAIGAIGYYRQAYLHGEFGFSSNSFDEVRYHSEFRRQHAMSGGIFRKLWLYVYWPRFLAVHFLGALAVDLIESGKLTPEGYPIGSVDTFRSFLEREASEAPVGRYVFLHLIIPHPPYVLNGECGAEEGEDAREQYRCINQLIIELLAELRRLGRFNDSMVIIHADHGDDLEVKGRRIQNMVFKNDPDYRLGPKFNFPRSRALLLYKPFAHSAENSLRISDRPTTLLDITPTVLEAIGAEFPSTIGGPPLPKDVPSSRPRYFYVAAGIRQDRYLYTSNGLIFDRIMAVKPPATRKTDGKN